MPTKYFLLYVLDLHHGCITDRLVTSFQKIICYLRCEVHELFPWLPVIVPEMFVSLPELLSHAGVVNQILGVPPLFCSLQETQTSKWTALCPFSNGQDRNVGARRSTAQNQSRQIWYWRTSDAKYLTKAEVVEGQVWICTSILIGSVTSRHNCTEKEVKLKEIQQKCLIHTEKTMKFKQKGYASVSTFCRAINLKWQCTCFQNRWIKWSGRLENSKQKLQMQNPRAQISGIDFQAADNPLLKFHKLFLLW